MEKSSFFGRNWRENLSSEKAAVAVLCELKRFLFFCKDGQDGWNDVKIGRKFVIGKLNFGSFWCGWDI